MNVDDRSLLYRFLSLSLAFVNLWCSPSVLSCADFSLLEWSVMSSHLAPCLVQVVVVANQYFGWATSGAGAIIVSSVVICCIISTYPRHSSLIYSSWSSWSHCQIHLRAQQETIALVIRSGNQCNKLWFQLCWEAGSHCDAGWWDFQVDFARLPAFTYAWAAVRTTGVAA